MSDSTLHPAHPDVELLAEHAEELLPAEQSAGLTAHLDSCAECRETYAALAELTALLGDEPDAGPMPEDVAARIDAALAAERERPWDLDGATVAAVTEDTAAARTDAEGTTTDGAESDGAESDSAESDGGRTGASRRPAGERPADNRPGTRSRRSARMRRALVTLALCLAAGGIGIAVSRGGDLDSGANNSASANGGAQVVPHSLSAASSSAYDFTQANLVGEVQRLAGDAQAKSAGAAVGTVPSASPSSSGMAPHTAPNNGAQTVPGGASVAPSGSAEPTAPTCVLAATKRTDAPAVQGLGHYLGVEVFALLYPDATDPAHQWDVYLVQNSCSAPLVMLHQSVPRA
ncbi:hypothetical protein ABH931_000285 [Streptacidiphilus sp. MAP12-33]|uniref:zf-HC2 domain-containing protein n=1 Tax=Streptacidiphilus sp. MAP12-33 TaxID=3156266 RepID=UPI00351976E4